MSYTTRRNKYDFWEIFKGNEKVSKSLAFGSETRANQWIEQHLIPDADNCIKVIDLQMVVEELAVEDWTVGHYTNKGYLSLSK